MKFLYKLLLVPVTAAIVFSCSGNKKGESVPDTAFSQFISGYSGGFIPDGKPVSIVLSTAVVSPESESLFEFSPKLKGVQSIIAPGTVEFLPDAASIQPGIKYECSFNLGKAIGIQDKKFQNFKFSFYTPKKEAYLSTTLINTTARNTNVTSVLGLIELTTAGDPSLAVSADGKEGTISKDGETYYTYIINDIDRGDTDRKIKVVLTAGEGFQAKEPIELTIPGKKEFKVIDYSLEEEDTPYVQVVFSDPIAQVAMGLARVQGAGRYYTMQQDNILRVYFENHYEDDVTLLLDGRIKSSEGAVLGDDQEIKLEASRPKPAVEIPISGNIVPDSGNIILPFKAVSLNAVDVRIIKIFQSNVLSFLQENSLKGYSNLRRSGRLVYANTISLDEPGLDLHRWQNFSIDLSGLIKQEPGAIYRVRLSFKKEYSVYNRYEAVQGDLLKPQNEAEIQNEKDTWDIPSTDIWYDYDWNEYNWRERDNPNDPSYYMSDSRFPSINLLASEIGLIAKKTGDNKLFVAASNLLTSSPLSDVETSVYNFQLQKIGSGKTSSSGAVEIPTDGTPYIVVGKKGSSTSYLCVKDGEQKSVSRFDVGGSKLEKGMKAYIYGERGVWRPGDTLHLFMLLRNKGEVLPDNHPVTAELYNPSGQFYSKQVNGNGMDGFYRFDIPTDESDPTGIWNAYFKVGGSSFHKSVRIETVKPNRLKINPEFSSDILSSGQKTTIKVASNWLTGPAAAGLEVSAVMSLSSGGKFFKGFEGYEFSDPLKSLSGERIDLLNTRLDSYGHTQATVTMPAASDAPGMLSAYVLFSVRENGGDESLTGVSVPFSPYSAYVGIKAPEEGKNGYLETGKDLVFNVVTVDKNGKKVSGHNLEYKVYKLKWSWWWQGNSDDLYTYVNSSSAKVIGSGRITSGDNSSVSFRVEYPDWGRYLVYVKDKDSGHASGSIVLVDWPDYLGRSSKQDPDALSMLTFSTDKKSYKAGETALIYIPSAGGEGNALVSLENGSGIISSKWIKVQGKEDTVYKVKITEDMAPNFYINITLVQPHGNRNNDLPIRLYGVQPVSVENPGSVLTPIISMADSVHPEEKFTVGISEKNGKPMTYTIAIVDEGLLDLTSFKTPDPWNHMYAREALGVSTWDLYDDVTGAIGGKFRQMLSIGGDEEIAIGQKKENRFNPVVKVLGPFTLKKGTAKHEVQLPMYVGSVRVMVTAAKGDAYGKAEKAVTVKSPLMAVTTLPRILGESEEVTVPVNVFVLEEGFNDVKVSIKADGAATVAGNATASVHFDGPGDKIIQFRIKGTSSGNAKVKITASAAGHNTEETINLPVSNPNAPYVSVSYNTVAPGATETLKLSGKRSDAVLQLNAFPAIDYNGAFCFVKNYPYSCTEQLAAKGLVLLHSLDKLSEANQEAAGQMLGQIVNQIYARQLSDGGFAYWPSSLVSDPWVSSMAGILLYKVQAKGAAVSKEVLSSWLKFQKKVCGNYRNKQHKDGRFSLADLDQAFRLYSMAVSGNEDIAAMNRLKEADGLTPQARWMLASAYAVCGKKQVAENIISSIENGFAEYKTDRLTFGSSYRDKAIATEALALTGRLKEAIDLAQQIASLFGPGYTSTQESAFAAVALDALAKAVGSSPINVTIGGKDDIITTAGTATYPIDSKATELTVKNNEKGTVYTVVSETIQPSANDAVPARASGIKMDVKYYTDNGQSINPASLKQGTEFTAEITVANSGLADDYENVALKHVIPSGWEIFNERLFSNNVSAANAYDNLDIRDNSVIWYFGLDRGTSKTFKIRLRAAYKGVYVLPAITCEMMYNALISARTASGKAEVTD